MRIVNSTTSRWSGDQKRCPCSELPSTAAAASAQSKIMQVAGMATVVANVNRIVRRARSGCWVPAELDMPIWSLLDRSRAAESRHYPTGRYRRRPILCH